MRIITESFDVIIAVAFIVTVVIACARTLGM
jgi:hypothetical protein